MLVTRKEPENLKAEDLWLFKHELKKAFPDPQIINLKNVVINGEIHFTQNLKNNVLAAYHAAFFKYTVLQIIKRFIKQNLQFSFKRHFIITDSWSNGYFHWLLDCLPRLILIEDSGLNLPLILPHHLKDQRYVMESLAMLGFTNYRFLQNDKWYFFKSLCFPVHLAPTGNFHDGIIKKLRKRITPGTTSIPGLKIYISRSKALMRQVANEDEMVNVLSNLGFKTVYCEDMTFTEQVQLFAQAKYLWCRAVQYAFYGS